MGRAEEMPWEGPGPRGDLTVCSLSFPICTIGTVVLACWAWGQFGGIVPGKHIGPSPALSRCLRVAVTQNHRPRQRQSLAVDTPKPVGLPRDQLVCGSAAWGPLATSRDSWLS